MKSWYRTIREDELKGGSVRKVYHLVFETDDKNIVEKVEQFFCDVMDAKTEPQANADQHVQRVEYVGNDEKSRCWKCKHFESMHETPTSSDGSYYTYVVCTASECKYEPKDEPTISKMEQVEDEPQTDTVQGTGDCEHCSRLFVDCDGR